MTDIQRVYEALIRRYNAYYDYGVITEDEYTNKLEAIKDFCEELDYGETDE